MMYLRYVLLLFICSNYYSVLSQSVPPQNLKDSLLMHYTMEELRAMKSEERWNIIRKMRGQEPIDYSLAIKEFDDNGIKIVNDIPENTTSDIETKVKQIEEEKAYYRREVFPNTYADILGHYERRFYESFIARDFADQDYKARLADDVDLESSPYGNASRRTYYFNQAGKLRLVELEVSYNINEGKKVIWKYKTPYKYRKKTYYVYNDTLIFFQGISAKQRSTGGEPSMLHLEELDTAKVTYSEAKVYYYKNNGYRLLVKEGVSSKEEWRAYLLKLMFENRGEGSSNGAIWFRNYWLEYQEYKDGVNDYLMPVHTSFLKPYIVSPQ